MLRRAFTLMELLFVIIILAILVTIALPGFGRTTERAQQRQAWDMLQTIYAGEQVFFSVNNRFCDPTINGTQGAAGTSCDRTQSPGTATWAKIYVDDPTTTTASYTVSSTTVFASTFQATATRAAGGQCGGLTMTINEAHTMGGSGWLTCPMGGL